MRCPACGFVSFPNQTAFKKCGKPLPASAVGSRPAAPARPPALKPSPRPVVPAVPRAPAPPSSSPATPSDPFFVSSAGGSAASTPMLGGRHAGLPPAKDDGYNIPAASVDVHSREVYDPTVSLMTVGDLPPAGFWVRFVAFLMDAMIVAVISYLLLEKPLAVLLHRLASGLPPLEALETKWVRALASFLVTVVVLNSLPSLVYSVFFVGWRGRTPGKMLFGLKIIRKDGGEVGFVKAFLRFFAAFLLADLLFIGAMVWLLPPRNEASVVSAVVILSAVGLALVLAQLVGYVMAAFTTNNRALHDYIAGTRVIRL